MYKSKTGYLVYPFLSSTLKLDGLARWKNGRRSFLRMESFSKGGANDSKKKEIRATRGDRLSISLAGEICWSTIERKRSPRLATLISASTVRRVCENT